MLTPIESKDHSTRAVWTILLIIMWYGKNKKSTLKWL